MAMTWSSLATSRPAMPIRFQCPECQAKLKIGSHKVGVRKSCPHCSVDFIVPEPIEGDLPIAQRWSGEEVAASPPTTSPPAAAEGSGKKPPRPNAAEPKLDSVNSAAPPMPRSRQSSPEMTPDILRLEEISVPRRMIYVYGGLIAVVAIFFFLFGVMTGKNLDRTRAVVVAKSIESSVIKGTVMFRRDNQRLPDVESLVIVMPIESELDVRPEGEALHPSQKSAVESPDAQLIRTFGGEVSRVDAAGRFSFDLPGEQQYEVLVISANQQSDQEVSRNLRVAWGRVFVPIEPVIGEQAHHSTRLRTDEESVVLPPVVFD